MFLFYFFSGQDTLSDILRVFGLACGVGVVILQVLRQIDVSNQTQHLSITLKYTAIGCPRLELVFQLVEEYTC